MKAPDGCLHNSKSAGVAVTTIIDDYQSTHYISGFGIRPVTFLLLRASGANFPLRGGPHCHPVCSTRTKAFDDSSSRHAGEIKPACEQFCSGPHDVGQVVIWVSPHNNPCHGWATQMTAPATNHQQRLQTIPSSGQQLMWKAMLRGVTKPCLSPESSPSQCQSIPNEPCLAPRGVSGSP